MNKDKLLKKIQKLFAMAEMGFGNEAEIAMRKALPHAFLQALA